MNQNQKTNNRQKHQPMENNIKGLYKLVYGYSDHTHYFILTREQFEQIKELSEISIETSNHCYEDVDLSKTKLVTEDEEFVSKFLSLRLTTKFSPLDFLETE